MRRGVSASSYPARADLVTASGHSSSHANPNTYRWNSITSVTLSGTTYQAICFWNSSGNLVIGKRTLDGAWTLYTYNGGGGLATIAITAGDNHNVCSIGIDPDGFIHVCYDMHAVALKYRKSDAAINTWTGTLGDAISMVGTNESSVTYPTFVNDPAGNLYFLFRDGASANGDLFMYKYTHGTTTWAGVAGTTAGKLIDGKVSNPDCSAYWDHPCFDDDFGSGGFFHLSWHWRVTGNSGGNEDLCYVKWDGTNWKKANGDAQTVPITQANCETVDDTTGENNGMTSFNGLVSDSNGRPHIYYAKTTSSVRYLYQAYYNGSNWAITQLTTTSNPNLNDNSTYHVGLIPSAVVDRSDDTLFVFYCDVQDKGGILMLKSTNHFSTKTAKMVYPYSVGWWSPKYDYKEFDRSGNLYFSVEEYYGTLLAGQQSAFPIYVWKVDPTTL